MKNKFILITGASSGIGFETAILLDKLGYSVIAVVRKQADADNLKSITTNNFNVLLWDLYEIDKLGEITEKVIKIVANNGLYALINNAGYNYVSPFEYTNQNEARKEMEVNFFCSLFFSSEHDSTIQKVY